MLRLLRGWGREGGPKPDAIGLNHQFDGHYLGGVTGDCGRVFSKFFMRMRKTAFRIM